MGLLYSLLYATVSVVFSLGLLTVYALMLSASRADERAAAMIYPVRPDNQSSRSTRN